MKQRLLTVAFLIAAVLCYAAGSKPGMLVLTAAGLVLESMFWFRLVKPRRADHA